MSPSPSTLALIIEAAAGLLASIGGVAIFADWARRRRLLDLPNERSSHSRPIPRGAGAVIVAVVALSALIMLIMAAAGTYAATSQIAVTACAAILVAIVSAIDDVRSLSSELRLVVHGACALVVAAVITSNAPFWPGVLIGALWIAALTNAYNFMDGIDGIAGTQAVIAGLAFAWASKSAGAPFVTVVSIATAAASAGFLVHNWPPARVFLGDVGSAFLGFVFGSLTLMLFQQSPLAAIGAALSLWPFVFDTVFTLGRRAKRGEDLLRSHRSHLYQRLVISGWSHRAVTLLFTVGAAIAAVAGILLQRDARVFWLPAVLVVAALTFGIWQVAARSERSA
jgi:UDP-N-acetylmuramyl pentapeptide phosphotransferase/UDP-N-acetylglucosamine-1-phosphate transferase